MDLSTDLQAGTAHTIHHITLDLICEITVDTQTAMRITKTDKVTTETTIEIKGTNRTHGTTREIMVTRTGMIIIKIGRGLTIEDDPLSKKHYRNQPRTQVIFEYMDQNPLELMQTV